MLSAETLFNHLLYNARYKQAVCPKQKLLMLWNTLTLLLLQRLWSYMLHYYFLLVLLQAYSESCIFHRLALDSFIKSFHQELNHYAYVVAAIATFL